MLAISILVIGYFIIVLVISFATANRIEEKKNVFKKIRNRKRSIRARPTRGER